MLAFAAAITGVIGDTYDPTNPGLSGITGLGWGAIIVAALSFGVILIETYNDHVKIDWHAQQRAKVRRVANQQVTEAVMYLLNPFRAFLTDVWRRRQDLGIDLEQLDKGPSHVLDQLCKPNVRAEFEPVDLRGMVSSPFDGVTTSPSLRLRLENCLTKPRLSTAAISILTPSSLSSMFGPTNLYISDYLSLGNWS